MRRVLLALTAVMLVVLPTAAMGLAAGHRSTSTIATDATVDAGTNAAWDANKLNHIFGNPEHGLDSVTQSVGGESQVMDAAQASLQGSDIPSSGLFEVTRTIGGQTVTIRGAVVDGVPRIGTMWAAP